MIDCVIKCLFNRGWQRKKALLRYKKLFSLSFMISLNLPQTKCFYTLVIWKLKMKYVNIRTQTKTRNQAHTKQSVLTSFHRSMQQKIDVEVIYQTRETVFHHISKHWEESWKYDAQRSEYFWQNSRCLECDETLSRVFDVSSQSKLKLRSKRRNKIVKIYAN